MLSSNPDKALSSFPVICNSNRNKIEIIIVVIKTGMCTHVAINQLKSLKSMACALIQSEWVDHERTSKSTKDGTCNTSIVYGVGCVDTLHTIHFVTSL